tara:strand:- start:2910 stop:3641 length:732 start_codon:yes stop_codon:yes gene_type:complete
MKKYSYLGLILVIIVFSLIFIPKILERISEKKIISSNRTTTLSSSLAYIKINGEAKKVPQFILINQDSLYVSNEDYLGKVFLVEFFFSRCPTICPIMNKNMKSLYEIYGKKDDFGIASFSIDPENDTPSVLKSYSEGLTVNSLNWNFLTGQKSDIYSIANKGFNIFAGINPNVAGGFEHQGYFALIDKNGYLRSRIDKFGNPIVYYLGIENEFAPIQGVDMLVEDIALLLKENNLYKKNEFYR